MRRNLQTGRRILCRRDYGECCRDGSLYSARVFCLFAIPESQRWNDAGNSLRDWRQLSARVLSPRLGFLAGIGSLDRGVAAGGSAAVDTINMTAKKQPTAGFLYATIL